MFSFMCAEKLEKASHVVPVWDVPIYTKTSTLSSTEEGAIG